MDTGLTAHAISYLKIEAKRHRPARPGASSATRTPSARHPQGVAVNVWPPDPVDSLGRRRPSKK